MRSFRVGFALIIAGGIRLSLRLLGKGATALPGKIAVKIAPRFIREMASGCDIITVTGTNGKTTTTHMISESLRKSGYYVATNVSGANLSSGIATTFAQELRPVRRAVSKGLKPVYVLEIDEAAFAKVAGDLSPKVCVVTNLFRDQLDRFGELLYTRDCIEKGLDMTDALILLNADDSMIAALRKNRESRTEFYGVDERSMTRNNVTDTVASRALPASSDAEYCLSCKRKYEYGARSFGHFGTYSCSSCGDTRQEPQQSVYFDPTKSSSDPGLPLVFQGKDYSVEGVLPIPGSHNIYNAAAAFAACTSFGKIIGDPKLSPIQVAAALSEVQPAFGRMEKIRVGDKSFCILLVKNPVGLDRALSMVASASDADGMYLLLNSNIADGTDVSWIWDVDFESKTMPDKLYVSGERFGDMLLRLIYSGVDTNQLRYASMSEAFVLFEEALSACEPGKCLYVLPNYTSMLALRKFLVGKYRLKDFWR
ncbi:MAG: DUF1727 domain-containing protein [Clostridiaceae bacterium]|nr:DUF1727 domain-containing protein [Clostridiaceae bacterium]